VAHPLFLDQRIGDGQTVVAADCAHVATHDVLHPQTPLGHLFTLAVNLVPEIMPATPGRGLTYINSGRGRGAILPGQARTEPRSGPEPWVYRRSNSTLS
jgi:hypothetical protein